MRRCGDNKRHFSMIRFKYWSGQETARKWLQIPPPPRQSQSRFWVPLVSHSLWSSPVHPTRRCQSRPNRRHSLQRLQASHQSWTNLVQRGPLAEASLTSRCYCLSCRCPLSSSNRRWKEWYLSKKLQCLAQTRVIIMQTKSLTPFFNPCRVLCLSKKKVLFCRGILVHLKFFWILKKPENWGNEFNFLLYEYIV